MDRTRIRIPNSFKFTYKTAYDFNHVLKTFDWTIKGQEVVIDFSLCARANYQAIALIVLYSWHLWANGCTVKFRYGKRWMGASKMWAMMGAEGLFDVIESPHKNFSSTNVKPLFAVRNEDDFNDALSKAEKYSQGFDVEYEKTLRYILSELLYNTREHGWNKVIPSIIQFSWYVEKKELSFIVADLGMGIRKHLAQAYPALVDDKEAIKLALKPRVSGTFKSKQPYQAENNAGFGLFLSSNIVRKLHADMHIVSGDGVVHISPTDITGRILKVGWPGTIVYVTIKLSQVADINLQRMMAELRSAATIEMKKADKKEQDLNFYISIRNIFGNFAEEKVSAISYRDKAMLPAIKNGKVIILDFENVISAPHSFLNALLAVPTRHLGINAYKMIKIVNAAPVIRETIDFIFDENTSST